MTKVSRRFVTFCTIWRIERHNKRGHAFCLSVCSVISTCHREIEISRQAIKFWRFVRNSCCHIENASLTFRKNLHLFCSFWEVYVFFRNQHYEVSSYSIHKTQMTRNWKRVSQNFQINIFFRKPLTAHVWKQACAKLMPSSWHSGRFRYLSVGMGNSQY